MLPSVRNCSSNPGGKGWGGCWGAQQSQSVRAHERLICCDNLGSHERDKLAGRCCSGDFLQRMSTKGHGCRKQSYSGFPKLRDSEESHFKSVLPPPSAAAVLSLDKISFVSDFWVEGQRLKGQGLAGAVETLQRTHSMGKSPALPPCRWGGR